MKVIVRPRTKGPGFEVDIHVQTPDGRRLRKRVKSPVSSRSGSQRWGEERARHLAMHGDVKPSAAATEPKKKEVPTLAEFVDEFMAHQATINKPAELRVKRSIIVHHLVPAFGSTPLDSIDARAIARYASAKLGAPTQRGADPISPQTVKNHLTVLARMLRVAHKWGLIDRVPDVEKPRVPAQSFRYLDFDEAETYLRTAAEHVPEWHPFLLVAVRTGLRLGELLALRWGHVDLRRRVIHVEAGHTAEGGFDTPKNDRTRDVPLTLDAVAALRQLGPGEPGALVFPGESGGVLSRKGVAHRVARVARLSGLDHLHPHALRHTFASHCVMRGVPLVQLQRWMGHATMDMTCRYAHLSPDFGTEMIDRLDSGAGAPAERPEKPTTRRPKKPKKSIT